ncbi:MAG: hypothetical protein EAZ89_15935 [Bacteroidetes bacterium]|jgi:hypothetical protein|nr:MAG: hypothetical protein EAZ89_15935 [Bacteroidota bacterium]
MDIVNQLDDLETLYYGDWEENKEKLLSALMELHLEAGQDENTFNRFLVEASGRFGGAYIPYLFWDKLSYYLDSAPERAYLQKLIQDFVEADFDEEEQKKMKPLLVTYFAREKDFEIGKIRYMLLEKAHPMIQEYFEKLLTFVNKNQKATDMYVEKFLMLRSIYPDFGLLNLPITQLKDKLKGL